MLCRYRPELVKGITTATARLSRLALLISGRYRPELVKGITTYNPNLTTLAAGSRYRPELVKGITTNNPASQRRNEKVM